MTVYKRSFEITLGISVFSFLLAFVMHRMVSLEDLGFWTNVLLGVFGSSLLAAITSLIGYFSEKRKLMEAFFSETIKILGIFCRYQVDLSLEQKIDFYLSWDDYDNGAWDLAFGGMDFFDNKSRRYIYNTIYHPIHDILLKFKSHSIHFRMHKNGTGVNSAVMSDFVAELEEYFIGGSLYSFNNDVGLVIENRIDKAFIEGMFNELNGKYYVLMYGKKKARRNLSEKKMTER